MTCVRLCLAALILMSALLGGCTDETLTPPTPTVVKISRLPGEYLDNRFFFVDQVDGADNPGRVADRELIDLSSLKVFVRQADGTTQANDVANMAAYLDPSGIWTGIDFQAPAYQAFRWQEVDYSLRLDTEGELECFDLGEALPLDSVMGICYDVVSPQGDYLYPVGDRPGRDEDSRVVLPGGDLYYRLKLIKPEWADHSVFTFDYVRRNVYSLASAHIDPAAFTFRIRTLQADDRDPHLDEGLLPYLRVFGLDKWNADGRYIPDNQPDFQDSSVFDLEHGLLYFPVAFAEPFNGSRIQYQTNANSSNFFWDGTYLASHLIPQIYSHETHPDDYASFAPFRIDLEFER